MGGLLASLGIVVIELCRDVLSRDLKRPERVPTGIDVRLMEADGFRRTQLVKDASAVEIVEQNWKTKLHEGGWG